jgi:hypothetical protein
MALRGTSHWTIELPTRSLSSATTSQLLTVSQRFRLIERQAASAYWSVANLAD